MKRISRTTKCLDHFFNRTASLILILIDPAVWTLVGVCSWMKMFPRPQRHAPSTPPLPLRSLQFVAKKPEASVVFRDHRKAKDHVPGFRESWPRAGLTTSEPKPRMTQRSLTPPFWGQPVTEAPPKTTNQLKPHMTSSLTHNPQLTTTPHPHWSVPARALPHGLGSEATITSLLLFCRR